MQRNGQQLKAADDVGSLSLEGAELSSTLEVLQLYHEKVRGFLPAYIPL